MRILVDDELIEERDNEPIEEVIKEINIYYPDFKLEITNLGGNGNECIVECVVIETKEKKVYIDYEERWEEGWFDNE